MPRIAPSHAPKRTHSPFATAVRATAVAMGLLFAVLVMGSLLVGWSAQPALVRFVPAIDSVGAATPVAILRVIIPVFLTLCLLLALVAADVRRRRRQSTHAAVVSVRVPAPALAADRTMSAPLVGTRASSMGLATAEAYSDVTPVVPPGLGARSDRACEVCGRVFDSALAMCPFDGGELGPPGASGRHVAEGEDGIDTAITQMACSTCTRAYELGAQFCPHDGTALEKLEERPHAHEAGTICPACGMLCEPDAVFCPADQTRLHVHSEDDETLLSAAPLKVCTRCAREYSSSQTRCGDCELPLSFLHGRKTSGLAIEHSDPTRICPSCGTRYLGVLSYCAQDGEVLVTLN